VNRKNVRRMNWEILIEGEEWCVIHNDFSHDDYDDDEVGLMSAMT
jgi:hypothetical protein